MHAFIEKFLTDESPHYVPRSTISAKDAIALLHASGGRGYLVASGDSLSE